jgi:hypothetical protein
VDIVKQIYLTDDDSKAALDVLATTLLKLAELEVELKTAEFD